MTYLKPETAWMLRMDGRAFPCAWHYYGNTDLEEIEETIYAAEWLYDAVEDAKVRQQCLNLIYTYGVSLNPRRNGMRNLLLAIKERPYKFLSYEFLEKHDREFRCSDPTQLPELNAAVNRALNGEFTRVRLGGMYDTVPGNRDLYFRVSGKDFDWLPVLRSFAEAHREDADTVTVLWDLESTGHNDFWTDEAGRVLDHVKIKTFLAE